MTRFLQCASACDRVTWNSFFTERYTWDTSQASKTPCTALERISLESDNGGRVWYNSPIVYIHTSGQTISLWGVGITFSMKWNGLMGHTVFPSYESQGLQVLSLKKFWKLWFMKIFTSILHITLAIFYFLIFFLVGESKLNPTKLRL